MLKIEPRFGMDAKVLQKLTAIKQKFRELSALDREKLGIAFLKINLGVNSDADTTLARQFIQGLHVELKKDRLDAFMNYLHATSSQIPIDLLEQGHQGVAHAAIEKQISQKFRKSDLSTYNEDEVETLKDYPRPFPRN